MIIIKLQLQYFDFAHLLMPKIRYGMNDSPGPSLLQQDMQLCLPFLQEEMRQDQLRALQGHLAVWYADVPLI